MENIIFELDRLDGHAFEDAMAVLFERLRYVVRRTPKTGDEGRDLILHSAAETVIVECKHQASLVGRPVVQKLHSAVSTYPNAKKGIIVTSNSFSRGAIEYASSLKAKTGIEILLWDYNSLLYRAKSVNIFLTSSRQSSSIYFHVRPRSDDELTLTLKQQYISQLISTPRATQDVSVVRIDAHELVPIVFVDYQIEKAFSTQAGVIHEISDRGRRAYEMRKGSIKSHERDYWIDSQVRECTSAVIEGKRLPMYFGKSVHSYTTALASTLARKHSRVVQYLGQNSRTYSKACHVNPADVQTSAQQVLLSRWQVSLLIGPRRYEIVFADDAQKPVLISSTSGFGESEDAFFNGSAMICNDCAQIVPRIGYGAGVECTRCAKTLCAAHCWLYPSPIPFRWSNYCSSCYLSMSAVATGFKYRSLIPIMFLASALSAFIAFTCYTFGLSVVAIACIAVDVCAALCWLLISRKHRLNLRSLRFYVPSWND